MKTALLSRKKQRTGKNKNNMHLFQKQTIKQQKNPNANVKAYINKQANKTSQLNKKQTQKKLNVILLHHQPPTY